MSKILHQARPFDVQSFKPLGQAAPDVQRLRGQKNVHGAPTLIQIDVRNCELVAKFPFAISETRCGSIFVITAPPKRGWVDETTMRPAEPGGSKSLEILKMVKMKLI